MEFMERIIPVVDETIRTLAAVRFVEDPIAGVRYSRATSIISSAYKRHGHILELTALSLFIAIRQTPITCPITSFMWLLAVFGNAPRTNRERFPLEIQRYVNDCSAIGALFGEPAIRAMARDHQLLFRWDHESGDAACGTARMLPGHDMA